MNLKIKTYLNKNKNCKMNSQSEKFLFNPDETFETDMSILMHSINRKKIKRN